jgi:hypothetical protein
VIGPWGNDPARQGGAVTTLRNNAYVFAHNGFLGYPTGKKIELPQAWERLLAERG